MDNPGQYTSNPQLPASALAALRQQSMVNGPSNLTGAGDLFDTLLRTRGAGTPAPTANVLPPGMPTNFLGQEQASSASQNSDFLGQLSSISDRITQQRQAAEDQIYANSQAAQQAALMRRIQAMIPQQSPSYNGGSGGTGYTPPNNDGIMGNPGGGGGGNNYPGYQLPQVSPPGFPPMGGNGVVPPPAIAPPRPWRDLFGN